MIQQIQQLAQHHARSAAMQCAAHGGTTEEQARDATAAYQAVLQAQHTMAAVATAPESDTVASLKTAGEEAKEPKKRSRSVQIVEIAVLPWSPGTIAKLASQMVIGERSF